MTKLNKMLVRDLKEQRGSFAAAVTIVMLGIALFIAVLGAQSNLEKSLNHYYDSYHFLDYQALVNNVSDTKIKDITSIYNVKTAIGRQVIEVGSNTKNNRRVTFRIISVPDDQMPAVNSLFIESGKYLKNGDKISCLLNKSFADYHGYKPGDQLTAILNEVEYEIVIDGIVESPEFLYAIKDPSFPYPSPEDFGIMYMGQSSIRDVYGEINFNEIHVTFVNPENTYETVREIEKKLVYSGFANGLEREDQTSHYMITDEMNQLGQMAVIFPTLFLVVAAFIIFMMMNRLIRKQRTLIGVLKALGYTDKQIVSHYIKIAVLISLFGSVLGVISGSILSDMMTTNYTQIYHLPVLVKEFYIGNACVGIVFSGFFCICSGYISSRKILLIEAAQAMRSEVPQAGTHIFIDRISWLWKPLSFGWKFSIRNLFRNRQRMFMTVMSISFTVMFFMISLFFGDAIDHMINYQFNVMQTQDYKVSFSDTLSSRSVQELDQITGVKDVEPIFEASLKLENMWLKEDILIRGISQNSMQRLMDKNEHFISVPKSGIAIPETLSETMKISVGDTVVLKGYLGKKIEEPVLVSEIIKQYTGSTCIMDLRYMQDLLGIDRVSNGAFLKTKTRNETLMLDQIYEIPTIKSLEKKENTLMKFNKLLKVFYSFIITMLLFGAGMGFAIIFNSTLLSIMDRQRELASLKVIGYSMKEIESTITRENLIQTLMAVFPGWILGYLMCVLLAKAFSNDVMTIEVIITLRTYAISTASIFVFVYLSQIKSRKHIQELDMIEVLKNREG